MQDVRIGTACFWRACHDWPGVLRAMNLGPAVCRVHLPSLAGALRLHSRFVRFSETRRLFSQSRPWNRFKRCAQAGECPRLPPRALFAALACAGRLAGGGDTVCA